MSLHLPTVLAVIVSLVWIYLIFGRGAFWRTSLAAEKSENRGPVKIAAIVPARNEAEVIGRALQSLLQQNGVDLHIYLVDDHSSDNTTQVARAIARSGRLTIIAGRPLPPGWSGKVWAMQQGLEQAVKSAPDYLLFTDADVEHAADNVARLVAIAEARRSDLTSFMVKLHCESFAEKLLIPAFVFFFFKLYPPKWISDPRRTTAGAAGGCILIHPRSLAHAGGLERIRAEIIDDCSLAREVKRSGGRVWLGLTDSARSIRPYRTFGEVERMIARTAFNQLGHSAVLLVFSIVGLLLTYIAPILLLFGSAKILAWLGVFALALMTLAYLPMVRFYRLNPLWALTLPLAAIFYMGATVHSALKYWSGRGGQWKGRVQDGTRPEASRVN